MKSANGHDSTGERPRLAAIDVGTNSIRLVVAEVEPDGGYRVLDEERSMTRLGSGLDKSGALSREAMLRSVEALAKMKAIADGFRVGQLRAIATSAVREASNGSEFRAEVKRRCGVNVEVISAAEEGRLAMHSAARHFALDGRPTAVVDIGGGSMEVVLSGGALIEQMHSLALGAVRLTERFARSDPWRRVERKALIREIDDVIKEHLGKPLLRPEVMVGSGGTFTTLAQMIRLQREGQEGRVHGYVITRTEIAEWLRRLFETPMAQRRQIPGLNPQRADIIVAGAAAIVRLARKLRVQQILINEGGVRDGMMFAMIARRRTGARRGCVPLRASAVRTKRTANMSPDWPFRCSTRCAGPTTCRTKSARFSRPGRCCTTSATSSGMPSITNTLTTSSCTAKCPVLRGGSWRWWPISHGTTAARSQRNRTSSSGVCPRRIGGWFACWRAFCAWPTRWIGPTISACKRCVCCAAARRCGCN